MKEWCFVAHLHVVAETEKEACDAISVLFCELHSAQPGMPDGARVIPRRDSKIEIKEVGEVTTQ